MGNLNHGDRHASGEEAGMVKVEDKMFLINAPAMCLADVDYDMPDTCLAGEHEPYAGSRTLEVREGAEDVCLGLLGLAVQVIGAQKTMLTLQLTSVQHCALVG